MGKTTFLLCRIALIVAGCFLASWAALTENYIVLPILVVGWGGLLFFLRSKVKEVMKDERSDRIKEKTAGIAIPVFAAIAVITSAVLVLLGQNISSGLMQIGITVGYSVFALLIIYWIIYIYYAKNTKA